MNEFDTAIFGNHGGSHQLLETSLVGEDSLLEKLRFLVDRPVGHVGADVVWAPYWGCGPIEDYWVLWCGEQDHDAPRRNMVRSRVVLLRKASLDSFGNLDIPLSYLSPKGIETTAVPLSNIIDALVAGTLPVIVSGIIAAPTILQGLWPLLWPEARRKLSIRTLFGSESLESASKPHIVVVPKELAPRWRAHNVVDCSQGHRLGSNTSLIGRRDPNFDKLLRNNWSLLPGDFTIIDRLDRIAKSLRALQEGSGKLSDALLIIRTIEALPNGMALDDKESVLVSDIISRMSDATIVDIRAASLVRLDAVSDIIPKSEESISLWIHDNLPKQSDDDALWVLKHQAGDKHSLWWLRSVRNGLVKALLHMTPTWTEALWRWWLVDAEAFDWTLSMLPISVGTEEALVSYAPLSISPDLHSKLVSHCSKSEWPRLLARLLHDDIPFSEAITTLRAKVKHPEKGLDILLTGRAKAEVVEAAVMSGWEPLVACSAKWTANNPLLLESVDFHSKGALALLAAHLGQGGDIPSAASNENFLLELFNSCISGNALSTGIVKHLAGCAAHVAITYSRQEELWRVMDAPNQKAFLNATANVWLDAFFKDELQTKPGPTLSKAIRDQARGVFAKKPAHKLISYLRLFNEVSENEVIQWFSKENFDWQAGDHEKMAALLKERKWKDAVRSFRYSRVSDFNVVAWHARDLLSWWSKVGFAPDGLGDGYRGRVVLQSPMDSGILHITVSSPEGGEQSQKGKSLQREIKGILPASRSDRIDIAILVALDEEFDELFKLIEGDPKPVTDEEHGGYDYLHSLRIGQGPQYCCAMRLLGEMGPEEAARVAERVFSKWKPVTAISLGIAGSLDREIKLGDVVVASHVDDYASNLKAIDNGADGYRYIHRGSFQPTDHEYLQQVKDIPFAHAEYYLRWRNSCSENVSEAIPTDQVDQLRSASHLRQRPKIHRVHLASGPVVSASTAYRDWLHQRDSNLKAIEMEAAGFATAAHRRRSPIRAMVIRGISDFGDDRKSSLDVIGGGGIRRYAMRNATRFLFTLMELGVFPFQATGAQIE